MEPGQVSELEVLRGARQLIAHGWTQHKYVRTAEDGETTESDPRVAKWCILGALRHHERGRFVWGRFVCNLDALRRLERLCGNTLSAWNDAPGRTQAEVIDLLDRAIAECGG